MALKFIFLPVLSGLWFCSRTVIIIVNWAPIFFNLFPTLLLHLYNRFVSNHMIFHSVLVVLVVYIYFSQAFFLPFFLSTSALMRSLHHRIPFLLLLVCGVTTVTSHAAFAVSNNIILHLVSRFYCVSDFCDLQFLVGISSNSYPYSFILFFLLPVKCVLSSLPWLMYNLCIILRI